VCPSRSQARTESISTWLGRISIAEVARLVSFGATRGERRRPGDIAEWNVMADPDGNEFCISAPHQSSA